jgi:thymidine phosphorylase
VDLIAAAPEAAGVALRVCRAPLDFGEARMAVLPAEGPAGCARLAAGRVELSAGGRALCVGVLRATDPASPAPGAVGLSAAALAALGVAEGETVRARAALAPPSRAAMRRKVAGRALEEADIAALVRDVVEGRYAPEEVAGFAVAAARRLSVAEIAALARARAGHMPRFRWDAPVVADKHSLGGAPGSRISPIVVALVAAHGLPMPKTSSRAITSAAGTADVMETVARVDLDVPAFTRTMAAAGGAIAWNGPLTHSEFDRAIIAITRPLGLASARLDVSSILAKKLAMGATHVVIDIPVGRTAKIRTPAAGAALARLFEDVGAALGLAVEARPTDGAAPIGAGIGPALEMRDVLRVLRRDADAAPDLVAKALEFAAALIRRDPAVADAAAARARAAALLASGAALEAFERIADAQGRRTAPVGPAALTAEIPAPRSGRVARIDGFALAGAARAAGAPRDPGAGLDLLKARGATVRAGAPLARVHASDAPALKAAISALAAAAPFAVR